MAHNRISTLIILGAGTLLTGGACLLINTAWETSIIIQMGIRAFHTLQIASGVGSAAMLGGTTVVGISQLIQHQRQLALTAQESVKQIEAKPDLKARGDIDPVKVKDNLESLYMSWDTAKFRDRFNKLFIEMSTMDSYQDKLKLLLDKNGAEALRDTEDILNKVEQHLCRNVRKVINTMLVLDCNVPGDQKTAAEVMDTCAENNDKLLESTKNFMLSVSQALNNQDGDEGTLQELESYKNILTRQINNGGI